MGKSSRQIKAAQRGNTSAIEHIETTDDSFLPEAVELAKYKEVDPECVNWLKARAEQEQAARINFNERRMSLFENSNSRIHSLDLLRVIFAFVIIMSGMAFSSFLIYSGLKTQGTLFAGTTIVIAALAFLRFRKSSSEINK